MRPLHRRLFLGALGAPLYASLPRSAAAADAYTLRFGFPLAAVSVMGQAAIRFASAVHRRTNGQLTVEVFPSGQLASESALVDAVITGVVDLSIHSTSWIEGMLPSFQVLGMPFLFRNQAAGHKLLDGPIGRDLLAQLEPRGMIGYAWTGAFREVWTASRAVSRPEDMKGIRVRIPGGIVGLAMYQALGGVALTIDMSEVVTSLNQHVMDGIDTIVDGFTSQKLYVAAKHGNMLNHIISVNLMAGSRRKIEVLPVALQRVLKEEAATANTFWRTLIVRQTAEEVEVLKANGVTFSDIQYGAFRSAVEPVYAMFQPKIGELLERAVRATSAG